MIWLVLRDVIAMLAAGSLLGLIASFAAGRLITSLSDLVPELSER